MAKQMDSHLKAPLYLKMAAIWMSVSLGFLPAFGFGKVPYSALKINSFYEDFDAEKRFEVRLPEAKRASSLYMQ